MLYTIIVALFAVLVVVGVKLAQAARELRRIKAVLEFVEQDSISHDSALYACDRRYQSGVKEGKAEGLKQGLLAAEKAATDALVAGKPPVMAIRALRNATK
jgi:tetrahydromethanopterin S-methyltransferase subunit F